MISLLLASLAWSSAPAEGAVTLRGPTWARLVAVPHDAPSLGHGPAAVSRQVRVRWRDDIAHVSAKWTVKAQQPGWWQVRVAGPGVFVERVTYGGRPTSTRSDARGTYVTVRVVGTSSLQLEGSLRDDPTRRPAVLELAPASIGTVEVEAGELRGRVTGDDVVPVDQMWWGAGGKLRLEVGPVGRSQRDRRPLAVATSGVGLTVADGELRGQARLRWRLRQGQLSSVSFVAQNVGDDLDVSGAAVAGWRRQGDRVTVQLNRPMQGMVQLDVRWTSPLSASAQARVALPQVVPADAFRVLSSLQLAKDSELEVVPELDGWTAIAAGSLQPWGVALIDGTPTAAYRVAGAAKAGSLSLLRFVPVPQPDVVVDVAAYTMTASAEGRTLVRALYTVRNERSGNLRFRPPAGHSVVAVRVAGQTATPARTGDSWVIPLPRSVETIEGLVSFPVEVVLLGRLDDGWSRRELRELALPQVGAPVAVNRVTLTLPPTWTDQLEHGEYGRIVEFSEGDGIAYGFGIGGAAEAQADQVWQDAMGAYMSNDFDEADDLLDSLDAMGADNNNLSRLRSNLDVVQGRASGAESAMSRRVVAQAWSRGEEDRRTREEVLREAEKELDAGNYDVAEVAYNRASSLSKKLAKVEQRESVEEEGKVKYSLDNAVKAKSEKAEHVKNQAFYAASSQAGSSRIRKRDRVIVVDDEVVINVDDGEFRDVDAPESDDDYMPIDAVVVTPQPVRDIQPTAPSPVVASGGGNFVGGLVALDDTSRAAPPQERSQILDSAEPLQVSSTSMSVVVPVLGQTIRYQHLLLPADAHVVVHVEARAPRSSIRSLL